MSGPCADPWLAGPHGGCFAVFSTPVSLKRCALDICGPRNASVACVPDEITNDFIVDLMKTKMEMGLDQSYSAAGEGEAWIGLYQDLGRVTFDGPLYTNWVSGCNSTYRNWDDLDDGNCADEKCLTVSSYNGVWDDRHCTSAFGCVCERDGPGSLGHSLDDVWGAGSARSADPTDSTDSTDLAWASTGSPHSAAFLSDMGELEAINLQSIITCQFFVIAIVFGGVVAASVLPWILAQIRWVCMSCSNMVHPDEDAISAGRWSGAAVRTGRVFGKLIGWCIAVRVWGLGLGGVFIVQLTTKIACVVVQPNTNGVRWHGNPWPGVVDDRDQVNSAWQVFGLALFWASAAVMIELVISWCTLAAEKVKEMAYEDWQDEHFLDEFGMDGRAATTRTSSRTNSRSGAAKSISRVIIGKKKSLKVKPAPDDARKAGLKKLPLPPKHARSPTQSPVVDGARGVKQEGDAGAEAKVGGDIEDGLDDLGSAGRLDDREDGPSTATTVSSASSYADPSDADAAPVPHDDFRGRRASQLSPAATLIVRKMLGEVEDVETMLESVDRAYLERIDEVAGKIVRDVRSAKLGTQEAYEEILRKFGLALQLTASSTFDMFKQQLMSSVGDERRASVVRNQFLRRASTNQYPKWLRGGSGRRGAENGRDGGDGGDERGDGAEAAGSQAKARLKKVISESILGKKKFDDNCRTLRSLLLRFPRCSEETEKVIGAKGLEWVGKPRRANEGKLNSWLARWTDVTATTADSALFSSDGVWIWAGLASSFMVIGLFIVAIFVRYFVEHPTHPTLVTGMLVGFSVMAIAAAQQRGDRRLAKRITLALSFVLAVGFGILSSELGAWMGVGREGLPALYEGKHWAWASAALRNGLGFGGWSASFIFVGLVYYPHLSFWLLFVAMSAVIIVTAVLMHADGNTTTLALLFTYLTARNSFLRRLALIEADSMVQTDMQAYDKIWLKLKGKGEEGGEDLAKLKACWDEIMGEDGVAVHGRKRQPECFGTVENLFHAADTINALFHSKLKRICIALGGKFYKADVKGEDRAMQKVFRSYKEDILRLTDLNRCSLVFKTFDDIRECLAAIAADPSIVVLKVAS
mmetsp:Transcript_20104/g.46560  ORF Transcript_20104/g.46560 Transcript_20104/m.46560 type:complete len:1093 (+) Transcript_20104:256-3534(+)